MVNIENKSNFTINSNHIVLPLIVITAVSFGTVYEIFQHICELLLILILGSFAVNYKLEKTEAILVCIFLFSQIGSFFINDFLIFILNAKQFGLAILSILYFRRNSKKSKFIFYTAIVCIFLVFYELLAGSLPFNIRPHLSTMRDSYGSRPLGLFLNYHFSSFFLAIFFIGYTLRKRIYLLDFLTLITINAKTNLLAYFIHKLSLIRFFNFFVDNYKKIIFLLIIIFFLLNIYIDTIIKFFEGYYGFYSLYIILKQSIELNSYLEAIYIFPQDLLLHLKKNSLSDFSSLSSIIDFSSHASEIEIIRILVQGGIVLAITYLYVFFKTFIKFRIFILITLFHYSFILNPLIIYLLSTFEFNDD